MEYFIVFNTVFFSIILQAFPFLLLGILLSSALHVFVSDDLIIKIFPTKWGLGFLTAIFAGFLFPVCECATIPVMKKLIEKGVAIPITVTFILIAPIVNPISIFATLYAFPQMPFVALYRVIFGIIVSLLVGIFLFFYPNKNILKDKYLDEKFNCIEHRQKKNNSIKNTIQEKTKALFLHSSEEFLSVGKFLIIGAMLASLVRVFTPENLFTNTNAQGFLGIIIQMFFAFIFSACSTSDAFIARTFISRFSIASIMGFLVYGPMMDLKNIFMLMSFFKKRFVINLSLAITLINILAIPILAHIFL